MHGDSRIMASYSFNRPIAVLSDSNWESGRGLWSCKVGLLDVKNLHQFRNKLWCCGHTHTLSIAQTYILNWICTQDNIK